MRPTPVPTQSYNYYSYSTYRDYDYAFSCPYPDDMYKTSALSDFTRYCLGSYDGGVIYICGTTNSAGLSSASVANNFKKDHYHTSVITNTIGSNFCSILVTDGSKYHYCYYSLTEGMIRGFEMSFYSDDYDKYMDHADYMRTNLSL